MNHHDATLDEFEPWEVEAYLDGEPMPHVAAFLAQNPAALDALRQEQARTAQIRLALYRFDCPSPATLQAYHWGELSASVHGQLTAHLQQCPRCSTELATLQTFVSEPQPVTKPQAAATPAQPGILEQLQDWLDQVRVLVATLVAPSGPQVAGVALRSTATAAPLMYLFEAENTDVSLLVHKQLDGTYRVDGQVFAAMPLADTRYALTSTELAVPPITGAVNATGSFAIPALSSGLYQLVLKLPDRAIVVPNLTLD